MKPSDGSCQEEITPLNSFKPQQHSNTHPPKTRTHARLAPLNNSTLNSPTTSLTVHTCQRRHVIPRILRILRPNRLCDSCLRLCSITMCLVPQPNVQQRIKHIV